VVISPKRLREMRVLLDTAPITYSSTDVHACDAAALRIESLEAAVLAAKVLLENEGQYADAVDDAIDILSNAYDPEH
jgi:hypothetical protein